MENHSRQTALDLIWIVPNLDEKIDVVKSNLLRCFNFSKHKGYSAKIILSDGGSSIEALENLRDFIKKLNIGNVSTEILLCFPVMRPNKDLGILNVIERYSAKHVVILDADLLSADEECLASLINPLMQGKAKIVLPNIVNRRLSGRINKLIINPLMRLFFPEIIKIIDFPLSGILGIDYDCLKKAVTSSGFFWDWGGEIQIIIRAFKSSNNSVEIFDHNREDAKRRALSSKMKDAYQITRAMLYEVSKDKKLDHDILKEKLTLSWTNNKYLVEKFFTWQKDNHVEIIPNISVLDDKFDNFLLSCSKNPKWFFTYLDEIYDKTGAYEILVLKNIAVEVLLKMLLGTKIKHKLKEVTPHVIESMNLEGISMLADVIFAVYICLWDNFNTIHQKDFRYFLKLLNFEDTDFVDADNLFYFRSQGLSSVDIDNIKPDQLKNILEVYNDKTKNISQKNKILINKISLCKK